MGLIKDNDTILDAIKKISDYNIGALGVLLNLASQKPILILLKSLDSIGIYGDSLFFLFKDICDENYNKFGTLIIAAEMDVIDKIKLRDVAARQLSECKGDYDFEVILAELDRKAKYIYNTINYN